MYCEVEVQLESFLAIGSRWIWVAIWTPWQIYSQGKGLDTHWISCRNQNRSRHTAENRNLQPCLESNTDSSDIHSVPSLYTDCATLLTLFHII
jgi:hypothetical protein